MRKPLMLLTLVASTSCLTPTFALPPSPDYATPLSLAISSLPASANSVGLTFYWENDGGFAKPNGSTDRHYTAGTALSVDWQAPWVNNLLSQLPSINDEFAPEHSRYALAVIGSLSIYTPDDLTNPNPILHERPYAGWLYAGFIAQRSSTAPNHLPVFEHFELDIGALGQNSFAREAQDWIHKFFDYTFPQGWENQIRNEYGADFKYQRRYRISLLPDHVDLLPEAGFTLGTVHINANVGTTLRFGFNLPQDFGPGRKDLPGDFTRARSPSRELTWDNLAHSLGAYGFIRTTGVAVAHDSTLEGSFFGSSPVEVEKEPLYAELQYGIAIQLLRHIELTYSQTWRSPQFEGQHNWDSTGTLTIAFAYAW